MDPRTCQSVAHGKSHSAIAVSPWQARGDGRPPRCSILVKAERQQFDSHPAENAFSRAFQRGGGREGDDRRQAAIVKCTAGKAVTAVRLQSRMTACGKFGLPELKHQARFLGTPDRLRKRTLNASYHNHAGEQYRLPAWHTNIDWAVRFRAGHGIPKAGFRRLILLLRQIGHACPLCRGDRNRSF